MIYNYVVMQNEFDTITALIRRRRSIFPVSYNQEEIPAKVIQQVLESANYAPTHKLTQPWRFIVYRQGGKARLAAEVARLYRLNTPCHQFLQKKYDSILEKADQANCIIALNLSLNPDKVPEWEEVAALACAVQNMALTAEALDLGAYWSSPAVIGDLKDFMGLAENEKCYGLFYMGYHNESPRDAVRTPIETKVRWVES